jgi:hypothetical protein
VKVLGFDADNPFSLFLILILLLAANGSFDPKTVSLSESAESSKKKSLWEDWTARPLTRRRSAPLISLGRTAIGSRIRLRRDLSVSMPKVLPLGR